MHKILLPALAVILLLSIVLSPELGYTSAKSDIDDALANVKKQEAEMQKKREESKQQSTLLGVTKKQEAVPPLPYLQ